MIHSGERIVGNPAGRIQTKRLAIRVGIALLTLERGSWFPAALAANARCLAVNRRPL
jgi:hypothetical protein